MVAKMRSGGTSLKHASHEVGIDPKTVTRWAGSAIKKGSNGRYSVSKNDRLLRVLQIPTAEGHREIGVRGSKQATVLGEYWAALHKYLRTGDATRLESFGKKVIKDASGIVWPLITDRTILDRLGSAGVLSFESLYAKSA